MAESILNRIPLHSFSFPLSDLQRDVDRLVGGFAEAATNWKTLTAIGAGGMAYRVGKLGAMGLGDGNLVRALSIGAGLSAEVSTFEITHRALNSVGAHLVFARHGFRDGRTQRC